MSMRDQSLCFSPALEVLCIRVAGGRVWSAAIVTTTQEQGGFREVNPVNHSHTRQSDCSTIRRCGSPTCRSPMLAALSWANPELGIENYKRLPGYTIDYMDLFGTQCGRSGHLPLR